MDFGNEPPLSVDGGASAYVDRRRVSAQWFSGTILTGLCGAALMGGAVFASLDGETNFATVPERVEMALRGAIGSVGEKLGVSARKSDRLPPAGESSAARTIIRVSTISRMGNREIVRVRPFVRVSANLSLTASEYASLVPPFNPQKLLADSDSETETTPTAAEATQAGPDAEVSFVTRDLAPLLPRIKIASVLSNDEVIARLREAASWTGSTKPGYTVASLPAGAAGKLAYAAEGSSDPYAGFEARIVPENITLLPKTATQATGGNSWNERTITVKKGETITSILRDLGATPEEAKALANALGPRGRDGGLKEAQKVRVLLSPIGSRVQPVRVIIANDNTVEAVVALSDTGKFVSVDVSAINSITEASEEEDDGSGMRLYQSIYETALRNQVPRQVVDGMMRIYSYDVDFQRKVQPGDSFDVIYAGEDESAAGDARSDILFAALSVGGDTKKFYRFQTPDDNVVDFYDETGKSAKKFLVRKPAAEGILRSGFGLRKHPILGYMKMHTGVDWAAPIGTPIYASGNGVIEKAGWESGYGKYIRIRHANGYETAYGHMTAFARGVDEGVRVRQGQVIGFVGSTGLSTGAHLHYEILVNGRFVDPMRIRLPRGRVLDGPVLAAFEQERDRLDNMMARGGSRVASSAH
jgi:murein DD-endopeptidase MepM/ murein hydrolase activator NlpD